MIRLILVLVTFIAFLIFTLPFQLIAYIMIKLGHQRKAKAMMLVFAKWMFIAVKFLAGTEVTVIGEENIPKDQSFLYVGNHNSYFDIVLTYMRVPGPTGYVAKSEMLKVPSLRTWMLLLDCLFLDRKDMKKGLMTIVQASENIKNGTSMFIFPEGTRNKNGDERQLLDFRDGALKIADKANCPIVPVAITGTADILERHFPLIKKSKVTIQYGAPIDVAAMDKAERKRLGAISKARILEMLEAQKGGSLTAES